MFSNKNENEAIYLHELVFFVGLKSLKNFSTMYILNLHLLCFFAKMRRSKDGDFYV